MFNCLVTGGAGFIGSHLAAAALKRGAEVRVLDNLSTGNLENFSHVRQKIDFIEGDVRDMSTVRACCKGVDVIFHLAAVVEVPRTIEDPLLSANVNDLGALNVFVAGRDQGAKKIVFSSSAAVYGCNPVVPHTESMTPAPASPYAVHKLVGEYYGSLFKDLYNIDVFSLRYFNVYGPRQNPNSPYSGVISILMNNAKNDGVFTIYGDGDQSRDFIFVDDVVEANLLIARESGESSQRVFNIATGRAITINELLKTVGDATGRPMSKISAAPRPGEIYHSWADVGLAKNILGFKADITLEAGLRKTWAWYNT